MTDNSTLHTYGHGMNPQKKKARISEGKKEFTAVPVHRVTTFEPFSLVACATPTARLPCSSDQILGERRFFRRPGYRVEVEVEDI